MPTETSMGLKACCECGADVAGQPRMKDSQGRYWCVPCGEADQKKRAIASPTAPCDGCHQQFAKGKLDPLGGHFYCKACLKKRSRAGGTHASPTAPALAASTNVASHTGGVAAVSRSHSGDSRRTLLMAAILVALLLFALLYNFVILSD